MQISHVYHVYMPQPLSKRERMKRHIAKVAEGKKRKDDKPLWYTREKTKGMYVQKHAKPSECISVVVSG